MSKVISLRQAWQGALGAFCGSLLFAATAAQAETKTWNLADDFPLIKQNPAPDKYNHKAVWYYKSGEADNSAEKYPKMPYFFDPAEEEAACGVKEFYFWSRRKAVGGTPAIWYNAGPTVEEGQSACAAYATFATKTVFMHPELGGKDWDAVVGWKSPITGTLTVSGSVQLVDSYPFKGISWELDRGATRVVGPSETFETNLMSFGPTAVSVVKGESLFLEVGRQRPALSGANDSTAVSLTISSP